MFGHSVKDGALVGTEDLTGLKCVAGMVDVQQKWGWW